RLSGHRCPHAKHALAPERRRIGQARCAQGARFSAAARRPAPAAAAERGTTGQHIDTGRSAATLGEAGMGAVFEAEHTAIGRIVAMKVLHPAQAGKKVAVKRFHQEARAAGGIGHPNICEVFDFGTLGDGSPYLVMERLKGETLAARIANEGGLPFLDVVDTVMQVLSCPAARPESTCITV